MGGVDASSGPWKLIDPQLQVAKLENITQHSAETCPDYQTNCTLAVTDTQSAHNGGTHWTREKIASSTHFKDLYF